MTGSVGRAALLLAGVLTTGCGGADAGPALTPQQVVDELLAADRGFSAAGGAGDLVTGMTAMFATDVIMPRPGGSFAEGADAVTEALRANPVLGRATGEWAPVRGGVSADGLHGFTYGFMTIRGTDSVAATAKYLSYWIRGEGGWRVAAYKLRPGPAPGNAAMMAPALPAAMVPPADSSAAARFAESLARAERDFSRDAQEIGLGPAFARYGSADAMNIGGPADTGFVIGNEAIAASVSAGGPATGSAVSWGPDRVIAASSGDLGVSIGVIVANAPAADGSQPRYAFFTVWRRADTTGPWRYVAE